MQFSVPLREPDFLCYTLVKKLGYFFKLREDVVEENAYFLDSNPSPNIIMTASALLSITIQIIKCFSLCFLISAPLHKRRNGQTQCSCTEGVKMPQEMSPCGYFAINKIHSWISHGNEGTNKWIGKRAPSEKKTTVWTFEMSKDMQFTCTHIKTTAIQKVEMVHRISRRTYTWPKMSLWCIFLTKTYAFLCYLWLSLNWYTEILAELCSIFCNDKDIYVN